MKKAYTRVLMAVALLASATPAYASANDWIRYQEAHDPVYNERPQYDTDGYGYDDSYYDDWNDYDYDYNHDRPSYRRPDHQDIQYCQHGLWVSTDQDCPEIERNPGKRFKRTSPIYDIYPYL